MDTADWTELISSVLAGLAVFLQVVLAVAAVLALTALFTRGGRTLLSDVRQALAGRELWLAWVIALVATLGSLYYSEIADFVPCRLCWFQRIAMYPLAVILLVAAIRRDGRSGVLYAAAFPLVGALIAAYHLYIEINPEAESEACRIGASCATKWIEQFGYVTLPVLSLTAFAAIAVLLGFAWSAAGAAGRDKPGKPPDLGS